MRVCSVGDVTGASLPLLKLKSATLNDTDNSYV